MTWSKDSAFGDHENFVENSREVWQRAVADRVRQDSHNEIQREAAHKINRKVAQHLEDALRAEDIDTALEHIREAMSLLDV